MKKYRVNRLYNGHSLYIRDPYNPYDLPDYTLRLKYESGKSPSISRGTSTRVSTSPNIWDVTYEDPNWDSWLANNFYLTDVLGGNTTNVTSMTKLFDNDRVLTSVNIFDTSNVKDMSYMYFFVGNLTSVPVYDTSNATNMASMFCYCSALTAIPQFNTQNVNSVSYMFKDCVNVVSGISAFYEQIKNNNPTHYSTFNNCGTNTTQGQAELELIPSGWK